MPTLLVIDDEPSILYAFGRAFGPPEVQLVTAATAAAGLQTIRENRPDVVVLDIQLPDQTGLETFRQIHQLDSRIPVIFITGHATTDVAIEAMKMGAFEFLLKPVDLAELRQLVRKGFAISRLMQTPVVVAGQVGDQAPFSAPEDNSLRPKKVPDPFPAACDVLVGNCRAMQEVYKAIGRVAAQDLTVLIQGESGTGKELVARAIYRHSRRAMAPFIALNCAAIPEALLESELFGHEKGAFTGAERQRIGKFEQCNGGTLFLDEVGDMSLMTQTKHLRVLQEQRFERVGGNETITTDVRILAATNQNLAHLADQGKFRRDLYYRLAEFTICLPPLKNRLEDMPLLVEYFLERFKAEIGKKVQQLAPATLETLCRYSWPGNVRELQSVLKHAVLHAAGPVLLPDFLPAAIRAGRGQAPFSASADDLQVPKKVPDPLPPWQSEKSDGSPPTTPPPVTLPDLERFIDDRLRARSQAIYHETLSQTERQLITQVLEYTAGNQLQAAGILGITRGSLRHKIRCLGIAVERFFSNGEMSKEQS